MPKMIRTLYILLIYMLLMGWASAFAFQKQSGTIQGIVIDTLMNGIESVTVSLRNQNGLVMEFTPTDREGRFTLKALATGQQGNLFIQVQSLGYEMKRIKIEPGQTYYEIILNTQQIVMDMVEIQRKPAIQLMGDTLSYHVASFAGHEDRNIGDVLKRLPGIEVSTSGQISYNGKTISNLYIDGDDLVDGRYGLISNTVDHTIIERIEVIRGHQPLRVLHGKFATDDIGINLVLRDDRRHSLSGNASLAAGLPGEYEGVLNAVLLGKSIKMLNVLKGNNIGTDYKIEFNRIGLPGYQQETNIEAPLPLLSSGTVGDPDVSQRLYFLNNSGVINANNLLNTRDGFQIKSNIQGYVDRNRSTYQSLSQIYTNQDTIRYEDEQYILRRTALFNAALTGTANKEDYFLNNSLRASISAFGNPSSIGFNKQYFDQRLENKDTKITNDLSYVPAMPNRHILEFQLNTGLLEYGQNLSIDTGLNANIVNGGLEYATINQQADRSHLFAHLGGGYRIPTTLIRQHYQAGIVADRQTLVSEMLLEQLDGSMTSQQIDPGNRFAWLQQQAYLRANFEIKKENWDAAVSLPLTLENIRYWQDEYNLDDRKTRLIFSPRLSGRYFLNGENYVQANYSYSSGSGNLMNVFRGAIMTNYRSIRANQADLQFTSTSQTSLNLNLQSSVSMLFGYINLSHRYISSNSIQSSMISNDIQYADLLPYKNHYNTYTLSAGISKALFLLSSSVSLKGMANRIQFNQIVNNDLLPFNNDMLMLTPGVDTRLFNHLTLRYTGNYIWNISQLTDGTPANRLRQQSLIRENHFRIGYTSVNFNASLTGKNTVTRREGILPRDYFFMDLNMRMKIPGWKADIEFDLHNMTNVKNYRLVSVSSNQFSVSDYHLRGMTAVLRTGINF